MATYDDTGLIFAGDVYMGEVDANGTLTAGMLGPINVPSFKLTPPTADAKTRISRQRATFGQALDTVNVPKDPAKVEIQFDSLPASLLAEAMGGTSTASTVTGASATDEAVTLVEGKWVMLAHNHLAASSVEVATAAAPTTPLVEGTDYEVEYTSGMVKALTSAAAVACLVDYDYESTTGYTVKGGTEINKPRRLRLVGKNLATGKDAIVEVDYALLIADQDLDLMGDDFKSGQLSGNLKTVSGQDAPFRVVMQ